MKINRYLKLYAVATVALLATTTSCEREEALSLPDETSLVNPIDELAITGKYIVVFRDEASKGISYKSNATYAERTLQARERINEILAIHSIPEDIVERTYSSSIFGFSGRLDAGQLDELRRNPDVAYIEQDRVIALAPPPGVGPGGGGSGGGGEVIPYGIARVGGPANGTGRTAWIIDSGVDLDHPDLNVDTGRSINLVSKGKDTGGDDGNGHGTHVAGTIAAIQGNGIGVAGVAAGATVVAVRVLDNNGSGSYSDVIAGVDYVGANAGSSDVANMSLGGPVSTALDDAVINAASGGPTFCIAAGNSGANADNYSPSRVSHNNVLVIAAIDANDNWASFSNYGSNVDYAAPGVSVQSTWKGGGYNTISGTSMASPHAAGVALMGNPSTDGSVSGPGGSYPIIHL